MQQLCHDDGGVLAMGKTSSRLFNSVFGLQAEYANQMPALFGLQSYPVGGWPVAHILPTCLLHKGIHHSKQKRGAT